MKSIVGFSSLRAAVLAMIAAVTVNAYAADVEIKVPPGGKVVVKDSTGTSTALIVDGAGPVTVPGLPASTVVSAGVVCFDANGTLAKCAPIIGAQGPVGPPGAVGAIGATGAAGPAGATGSTGATGITGSTGAVGTTGLAGAAGPIGGTGATGATGIAGPTGPVGATGLAGATGAAGAVGGTGAAGATGIAGPTGAVGATGLAGAAGAAGPVGGTGVAGATGATGPAPTISLTTYASSKISSPYDVTSITATCNTGVVISGGCETDTPAGASLSSSKRDGTTRWTCVFVMSQGVSVVRNTAYAYCM